MKPRRILVGEGSAEPTTGLLVALELFSPAPIEFVFGVRRAQEGLQSIDRPGVTLVAGFPGRGLSHFRQPSKACNLSAYQISRLMAAGRLPADALVVVATPPAVDGSRSLGTVNGYLQAAIDRAPLVIVEEDPNLPVIAGAARIPSQQPVHVIPHVPVAYRPLSREADEIDHACAEHIAALIDDGVTLQIGVGGIIEALAQTLRRKRDLRVITGAIGTTVRSLHEHGCLAPDQSILGSALVGDSDLMSWASGTPDIRLVQSMAVHNPRWLAQHRGFHSVNAAISVDLCGNVNSEWAGGRRVSGRGGAPDFARGAYLSRDGATVVAVRADRPTCLVERLHKPTIPAAHVSYVACERGVADLRGKSATQRAAALERLLA